MSTLSILITCLNDEFECNETLRSIRETAGERPEVIVIDDFSDPPLRLRDPLARLYRTAGRIGVGPARHMAAAYARSPYLLIIDCHMRFEPGWYETALERIVGRSQTLHCAACLPLMEGDMDMRKPREALTGATIDFEGLLQEDSGPARIFEGVWLPVRAEDDFELPCVMGAAYFIPREFFLRVGGLRMLRKWGSDEPYLSLKVWLAGGEVRMLTSVRIGHKFRTAPSYDTHAWNLVYNKIVAILTTLPEDVARLLLSKLELSPEFVTAMEQLEADWQQVEVERASLRALFVRDLRWYCEKFQIPYPDGRSPPGVGARRPLPPPPGEPNPFGFFSGLFCLNLDSQPERWLAASSRYHTLGIAQRVERFPALPTPENHHQGCTLSWRAMIAEADRRGYERMLGLEDDAIFLDTTLEVLRAAIPEVEGQQWDLLFLGAAVWSQSFPFLPGSHVLQESGPVTCCHAVAIHRRAYARILADIPPRGEAFDEWLKEWLAIDQYFHRKIADGTYRALIVSPRVATQPGLRDSVACDIALASRYVI